jgi:hypothetical protein
VITRLLQLPGVPTRENTGARGRALRIRSVGTGEQNSLLRHPIEPRRSHPLRAVGSHVRKRRIIGDAEQNIGPVVCRVICADETERHQNCGAAEKE